MFRALSLSTLALSSACSLLLSESGDDGNPNPDASVSTEPDASVTPADCARVEHFRDDFEGPIAMEWNQELNNGGTVAGSGGLVVMSLPTDSASSTRMLLSTMFEVTDPELTASLDTSSVTAQTDVSLGALITDGQPRRLEVGHLGQAVGLFGVNNNGTIAPAESGSFGVGRWRIRFSGQDAHIERSAPQSVSFERAGLVTFDTQGALQIELNARSRSAPEGLNAMFDFVELTSAPPDGWCDVGLLAYLPDRDETEELFEQLTIGSGAQISLGSEARLIASTTGELALLRSKARFNFESSAVVVRLTDVTAIGDSSVGITLSRSSRQKLGFDVSGGGLGTSVFDGASDRTAHGAFDVETRGYLRVSHADGSVDFEASPDGNSWELLRRAPVSFPVNDLELEIRAAAGDADAVIEVERIFGE